MMKIKHGFTGQRSVLFPFDLVNSALGNPLTSDLVIRSMGYFPRAVGHFIDRQSGCGEYLLIYCTKGEGWFRLNDKRYIVPQNHFFILPAETPHQYGSSESDPWHIYWAHFKGSKAKYIYEQLQGVVEIDVTSQSRISDRLSIFDEMLNVMESRLDEESLAYCSMSFSHLISTFLYIKIYREAKYAKQKSENTNFINRVIHYMYENIEKRLTLGEISAKFGYSESYFYRIFLKETGHSPINYFLFLKIDRACQLLSSTNLKINQIALKLGIDDPYYFSRLFKKIKGVSPREYKLSSNHDIQP